MTPNPLASDTLTWYRADRERLLSKIAELESGKAFVEQAHSKAVGDRSMALLELQSVKNACSDQVSLLNAQHATELATMQGRIDALKVTLKWTLDRDRTWRGVAIATVNDRLEAAIHE